MSYIHLKKKRKVVLVTYLREKNFGDILLFLTVKQKLENAGFATEAVEVYKTAELINKANKGDFIFFVGGGLIERSAPDIIKLFHLLYKHIRVPYGIVSLSTGAFEYEDFYTALRVLADNAVFFYTRDGETVETFRQAGAKRLPRQGVDIVFSNHMLAQFKCSGNQIGANFRDTPYPDITGELEWENWSTALKRIGAEILVRDSSGVQSALGIPIAETDEFAAISRCKYVVAMRYHVILVAAMMGSLPLPIDYCPKVRRLAVQLGIEDYCLGQGEHQKLEEKFNELKCNQKLLRSVVKNRVNRMTVLSNSIMQEAINRVKVISNE